MARGILNTKKFGIMSGLSSRHCLAVMPNIATFSTSASSAYFIAACSRVTSAGMRLLLMVGKAGLHSKVVKFDHFEIRIVYHLPSAKKLDGVPCTNPIFDDNTRLDYRRTILRFLVISLKVLTS